MSQAAIAKLFNKSAITVVEKHITVYGKDYKDERKIPYLGMVGDTYRRAEAVKTMRAMDGYTEIPAKQNSDAKTQVNFAFKNDKTGDVLFIRAALSNTANGFRTNSYSRTNAYMYYIKAESADAIAFWSASEDQVAKIKSDRKEKLAKQREAAKQADERWIKSIDLGAVDNYAVDLNAVPDLWMGLRSVLRSTTQLTDFNMLLAKVSRRAYDTRLGRLGPKAENLTEELAKVWVETVGNKIVEVAQACGLKAAFATNIVKVTGKQGTIVITVGIGRFTRGGGTYLTVTKQ